MPDLVKPLNLFSPTQTQTEAKYLLHQKPPLTEWQSTKRNNF